MKGASLRFVQPNFKHLRTTYSASAVAAVRRREYRLLEQLSETIREAGARWQDSYLYEAIKSQEREKP